ncbi:MAG TPA: dihydrolipoyl dehydrogenase [Clostridiales bacterium]|nr:dihydrolipoyl dehydrogenase [Clostridiales bacterium]
MILDIKLEKLSGHDRTGVIGCIYKAEGDIVKVGDEVLDIEVKKGNTTFSSDVEGKIIEIKVEQGDKVSIGDVLFTVEGEKAGSKGEAGKKQGFNYMANFLKPQKETIDGDIVVIGGGPGGYVAAIEGAKQGAKVILIEKENLGGTCLNRGCIPTKALVRSSEVYELVKNSKDYGIFNASSGYDFSEIIERKNEVVKELVGGIDYLMSKNNITVFKGSGEIMDKNTVFVKEKNKEVTINAKNIIIATGSVTFIPPIKGVESKNVLTSTEMLNLSKLPEKIIIVGGGVIGMEFAFICRALDADVSVVEFADDILIAMDEDVRSEIREAALEKGIKIYTGSKVEEIIDTEEGKSIVVFDNKGTKGYITGDKILMSVGRVPFYGNIDLEKIGISLNDKGRGIKVNSRMQTTAENIYAVGDVTNIIQLAHVASHQGLVAVENILGKDTEAEYSVIPSAIFTMPEIASVGITEKTAKEQGLSVKVGKFPFGANGKALTQGERRGFVKIITEEKTGIILGGAIIGPHATDLIHEVAVAVKNKLTAEQVINTVHAHPTTAEAVHEALLATTARGAIHFTE